MEPEKNKKLKLEKEEDEVYISYSSSNTTRSARPCSPPKKNTCDHWSFTYNGYTRDNLLDFWKILNEQCTNFEFQEECGEENKKLHLQGWIELKEGVSFRKLKFTLFKEHQCHWSKTKNKEAVLWYCRKEKTRVGKRINQDTEYGTMV